MCKKTVEVDPWQLGDNPDHLRTVEICDKAVRKDPFSLKFVPD